MDQFIKVYIMEVIVLGFKRYEYVMGESRGWDGGRVDKTLPIVVAQPATCEILVDVSGPRAL